MRVFALQKLMYGCTKMQYYVSSTRRYYTRNASCIISMFHCGILHIDGSLHYNMRDSITALATGTLLGHIKLLHLSFSLTQAGPALLWRNDAQNNVPNVCWNLDFRWWVAKVHTCDPLNFPIWDYLQWQSMLKVHFFYCIDQGRFEGNSQCYLWEYK